MTEWTNCTDTETLTRSNYIESITTKRDEVTKRLLAKMTLKGKKVILKEKKISKAAETIEK